MRDIHQFYRLLRFTTGIAGKAAIKTTACLRKNALRLLNSIHAMQKLSQSNGIPLQRHIPATQLMYFMVAIFTRLFAYVIVIHSCLKFRSNCLSIISGEQPPHTSTAPRQFVCVAQQSAPISDRSNRSPYRCTPGHSGNRYIQNRSLPYTPCNRPL